MSLEIMRVRGVTKNYGVRRCGGAVGQYNSSGPVKNLSFKINHDMLKDAKAGNLKLDTFMWAGSSVISCKLIVKKVFDATAAITFQLGDNASNMFPITAGQLNQVGVTDIVGDGTLAERELVETTELFKAVSVAVADTNLDGEAELLVEYIQTELP